MQPVQTLNETVDAAQGPAMSCERSAPMRVALRWQVLEILNDSEVRRLHEQEPPHQFGQEKGRRQEAGAERPSFWQWATGRQQEVA